MEYTLDFSLLGFINEFLNIENHLYLLDYLNPLLFWNPIVSITFHNVFIFLLRILKRVMSRVRGILLYWFLPYISVVFISQKERKINKKWVAIIDAICFIVLFLFAFKATRDYTFLPLSYYKEYDWCERYLVTLGILGIINSFLYSICFNFRLLKKYFDSLKIQKYEKLLFRIFIVLLSLFSYLFLFIYLVYI